MLQDIAILTGGQVISDELGLDLKEATLEQLGVRKIRESCKENTTYRRRSRDKEAIANRVAQIRDRLKRQNLTLTEKNFRKDLQNWQAA